MNPEQIAFLEQALRHDVVASAAIRPLLKSWLEREEALEFYADPHNYGVGGGSSTRIMTDHGQRARKAIGRKEEESVGEG